MPFNQPHMLFAWSGHFISSSTEVLDDFAGSLRFVGPGRDNNQTEEVMLGMAQTLVNWVNNQASGVPANALFDNFKWNAIGTDGRYLDRNNSLFTLGDVRGAGSLSARYPSQIACTTTWTTDFSRGRASKGRTFWPTAFPVDSSSRLRLSPATQLSMANWSYGLIRALNAAATTPGAIAYSSTATPIANDANQLSAAVMSDIGAGTSSIITGARVGDRLDIQRRRGNRLDESYVVNTN